MHAYRTRMSGGRRRRHDRRLRSALHEAGHAVGAVFCEKPLLFVTIDPNHPAYVPGSTGYTACIGDQLLQADRSDAWHHANVFWSLTGPVTEFLAFPDSPREVASGDLSYAADSIRVLSDRLAVGVEQAHVWLHSYFAQAERFVELEAEKIEEVAKILLARGTVSGDQVRAICSDQPWKCSWIELQILAPLSSASCDSQLRRNRD